MKYALYALACLAFCLLVSAPKAHAATITVSATGLQEVNTAGSYVTDGDCTLREAIKAANTDAAVDACTAGSGADTIVLPAGTYDATTIDNSVNGFPVITTPVTIQGAGMNSTIIRRSNDALTDDRGSATPGFRLFEVSSAGSLSLSGLTIRGGRIGAVNGGGVLSQGTLSLSSVKLAANLANQFGGALSQSGKTVSITDSIVDGNTSAPSAGGIYVTVGATATIRNTQVTNNVTSSPGWGGGALCDQNSTLTISGSTFTGNSALYGAAVQGGFYGDPTKGCTMAISDTEMSNNITTNYAVLDNYYAGSTTLTNVSVHNNTGAGVLIYQSDNSGGLGTNTITGGSFYGNTDSGLWIWESSKTTISGVTVHDNAKGIRIEGLVSDKVKVTQSKIYSNTGLGIDLPTIGSVTLNDAGDVDTGPNGILNFPVITRSQMVGDYLEVQGYSSPGATIELFKSDGDASGFGEGSAYLASRVEGSSDDSDSSSGTYGPGAVNGTVVGTDTTNKFSFKILISSLASPLSLADKVTSTATLAAQTSEFGNNSLVDGLSTSSLITAQVACAQATAGSTTTCAFTLPQNAVFVSGIKLSLGSTTPGGTCQLEGNGTTVTCTDVPVASTRGDNAVYIQIGSSSSTSDSGEKAVAVGPLVQQDVSTLATLASVKCVPTTSKKSTTITCSGTLPSYILQPSGALQFGTAGEKYVTCTFSGSTFTCKNIPVGGTVSEGPSSLTSKVASLFVGKAYAASKRSIYASIGGATPELIGLDIDTTSTAPSLARTGDDDLPFLGLGLILLTAAFYIRKKMA